ncbi:MAG: pyridoxal-phosphate dependent enzyme [Chloroflexi bacterium]|nr:pyridoxal-phosphate dependent enzyme [Chloroflexota bacterium]
MATTLDRVTGPSTFEEIRARVARVPRVSLAIAPTPLQELPRLAKTLGIGRLFVKRDDLTGLAFGGNKTRNLEFRLAEAVTLGADVVIAGLEAQSNSARQTTASANILGMRTILVLRTERDWDWQGNLLVDKILGADVRLVHAEGGAALDQILRDTAEEQKRLGHTPYVMNHMPGFAVGSALAYLLCTLEIVEQTAALEVTPTHLYMTSGNKGHAGLILGKKLLGASFRTVAISQRRGEDRVPGALSGARDAARQLGWDVELREGDVESYDDYVGEGYGIPTPEAIDAIRLAARTEGLILDPVYTGKAMAGLIDHARSGRLGADDTVVFIHTGGTPALFAFKDEIMAGLGIVKADASADARAGT